MSEGADLPVTSCEEPAWAPEARAHLVRRHLSELNSRMALSSQAMVKWRGELQPSQALKKRSRQRR